MKTRLFTVVAVMALVITLPLAAAGKDDVSVLLKSAGFAIPKSAVAAPDFTLASLDGTQVSLGSLRGKLVFVNFWATWCGPCQMEIPSLKALYEKMKDKGLVVLGVDLAESKDDVSRFVREKAMTFPVLLDSKGAVGSTYSSQSIPMTYVIDRSGNILGRKVGYDGSAWDSPQNVSLVEKLLAL